jgi:probable O-glycosylation ligase (exosortase A-associated)
MIVATLCGTAGVYVASPFYGVFVYYLFAVLRPQFIWQWSLPTGVNWSLYVALCTIGAAVLGLLGAFQVAHGSGGRQPATHRLSWAHGAVLLFAVWVLITYLTAHDREVAGYWTGEYLKIFVMYFVAAYLIRTELQVWALFLMVPVVLGYIAYEINYLYFVNNYLSIERNGYGGLDNNGAGLTLAMGLPLCWFAFEGLRSRWRWGFLVLIPIIVHAVLMSYSRGAMVSMIVACPFLVWRSRQRVRLVIALVCFALLALPVMAGPQIRARFMTLEQNELDDSANQRRASWAAAWRIAQDYPIFGVGVRNACLYSLQYGADSAGRTIHSQYLQIAADNGFPGLFLYLLMFGTAWASLRQSRRSVIGRTDPEARMVNAYASGIEVSLLLYSCGAIFLSLEVFELPFLLLLLSAQLPVVRAPDGLVPSEARITHPVLFQGVAREVMTR